jgi:hypothetical protein
MSQIVNMGKKGLGSPEKVMLLKVYRPCYNAGLRSWVSMNIGALSESNFLNVGLQNIGLKMLFS